MKVLLDTNIVLDVILQRQQWLADSAAVWEANHLRRIDGYLTATSLTNIFYIARRIIGTDKARRGVRTCLAAFDILPVAQADLFWADALPGSDFEDNLSIACAASTALDAIVTRDAHGFAASPIQVLSPAELLAQLPPQTII